MAGEDERCGIGRRLTRWSDRTFLAVQRPKIRTLSELDAMVGQFVIGEVPTTHWEDSQGLFRFETEEEALESLNDIYFQLFLPNLDWSQTVFVEIKSYRSYSTDFASTLEVIEKLAAQGQKFLLTKSNGKWVAEFGVSSSATAWSLAVAICAAALEAIGLDVEIDPGIA
jgi:hypothetical protein